MRGRYPYRSRAEYPTVADAYVAHVTRLHDYLKARGVRTMLWGDMLLAPGEAADAANAPSPAPGAADAGRGCRKDIEMTDWHYGAERPVHQPAPPARGGLRAGHRRDLGRRRATSARFSRALAAATERGLLQTTWAGYQLVRGQSAA